MGELQLYAAGENISLEDGLAQLRSLFQTGVHIEHTTIQPYLSAMYSIPEDANGAASWLLHSIVIEEMLHMTAMANILNAIGGTPCINSTSTVPHYPQHVSFVNLTLQVAPFSKESMKVFRHIEQPAFFTSDRTVATLYGNAARLLQELVDDYGEDAVFVGDPRLQVNFTSSRGSANPIYSHADAQQAISGVVHEGEGNISDISDMSPFSGDRELSHFYRFHEILEERFYAEGDTPSSGPSGRAMGIVWEHTNDFLPNPKAADYKLHPEIYAMMMQFNACYSDMLARLHAAFNGSPQDYASSLSKMHMLGQLARDLIATPSPLDPSKGVGPPWELIGLNSQHKCPFNMFSV